MLLTKKCLMSIILLLTVQCISSQAQKSAERAIGPCAVLSTGGTVYDMAECEELANTGRLVQKNEEGHPTAIVLVAGRTTEWQVVAKNEGKSVVNIPVKLISKKDHSIVARAVTDRKGKVSLSIPSSFQGDVGSIINGGGFCFRILPSENVTLQPICEDDAPALSWRVVQLRRR